MLRGSFTLVLTDDKLAFFEDIAKKAFQKITSSEISDLTPSSIGLDAIHLETDPGRVQKNRPGVYVIQNLINGKCIIGQTVNLKKRFNQYISRSQKEFQEKSGINKKFFLEVQEAMDKGLAYNQVFQRFVVYTWVDENKNPLNVQNSLELKNEMNYLEHRLILAFFESELAYNIKDVSPQLSEQVTLPETNNTNNPTTIAIRSAIPKITAGPGLAKAFKIEGLYFRSAVDYEKYRKSNSGNENKKKFQSSLTLRKKLRENESDQNSTTRYLTPEEITKAKEENLFYQPDP